MRTSFERKGSFGACLLVVRGERNERLDLAQAEALRAAHERFFLRMEAPDVRSRGVVLRYDVSGLVRLCDLARTRELAYGDLLGFVCDLLEALEWCAQRQVSSLQLLLNSRDVYVREGTGLCFACVPLRGLRARHLGTPLELVEFLCGRHVRFASADAASLASRLHGYASRSNGVFSAMGLKALLREERGEDERGRIVLHAAGEGTALALDTRRPCVVGRADGCDLRIAHSRLVSREHACVWAVAGGVMLRDLESTNGTTVGGRKVDSQHEVFVPVGGSFCLAGEEVHVQKEVDDVAGDSYSSRGVGQRRAAPVGRHR